MKQAAAVLLLWCCTASTAGGPRQYVQAVEFPYFLYPRALWERELTWLKNIGIRTVEFPIPRNWHQTGPEQFDITGQTSPRRDLQGLIRILRRLGLRAWIRPLGLVANWPETRAPEGDDARSRASWLKTLEAVLAPQTVSHGGPVEWMEGPGPKIDAGPPPRPVTRISATDSGAFLQSRKAVSSEAGPVLWTDVETALYPAGWESPPGSLLRPGAVGLSGDERPGAVALRREAALLKNWEPILPTLHPVTMPKPAAGKLPEGITAVELASSAISAVSISNESSRPFRDELRVFEPVSKRTMVIPSVSLPPGESMWLPLSVSLGPNGLCRECSHFSNAEQIVYATAELLGIEYENGILAMEFAAPEGGEVILQLEREPVGPFLASGKPSKFEWDDKSLRARLTIPPNPLGDHRVRIGIAMEEPETSAFFNDARRLVVGRQNTIATAYSSPEIATRSRLRLPEGYSSTPKQKSPNEIDYEVGVPADAIPGEFANLALEADGVLLGRARLQLFRPLSVRMIEAIQIHFGQHAELTPDPPVVTIDPKAGTNLEVSLRNNSLAIQTFRIQPEGEGLEFLPPKGEISIGGTDERRYSFRVFAREGIAGVRQWSLKVSGGADLDLPMRAVLLPRNETVVWTADLDSDGSAEWILETSRARAVFSSRDGGRWMEFTWKNSNVNFLPERGGFAAAAPVEILPVADGIEIKGAGWTRTVRLQNSTVTVEQTSGAPPDGLSPLTQNNVGLTIERTGGRSVFTLK